MRFKQFQQVALATDIPQKNLRRGDLATIVDIHPKNGGEVRLLDRNLQRAG